MVEFALMLPVFILVFLGLFGMAIIFFSFVTAQNAAREGARYVIANPAATTNEINTQICSVTAGFGSPSACLSKISSELVITVEPANASERNANVPVAVTIRYRVPVPTLSVSFLNQPAFTFLAPIWVSGRSVMRIE